MFDGKTMFVIGAGASKEAGLPTGDELKDHISSHLNFDQRDGNGIMRARYAVSSQRVGVALKALARSESERRQAFDAYQAYIAAAEHIRFALPAAPSIDNFIDSHAGNKDVELCGKLAIVQAILTAEKDSKLYVNPSNSLTKLDLENLLGTWYLELAKLLFENCRESDIPERLSKVSFCIFNYDRCLEHFLFWFLQIYYRMQPSKAADLLEAVNFFHPYGTVGSLRWQGKSKPVAGFGDDSADLLTLASQIKTFTEGTDEEASDIVKLRDAFRLAEITVFLGFGFHRLNMQLLMPKPWSRLNNKSQRKRYFGTAAGLSESDVKIVADRLIGTEQLTVSVNLRNDRYCKQLFEEYRLSIAGYL